MRPFQYQRAEDPGAAVRLAASAGAHYLAGGTTLVDLMKLGLMQPGNVIDINDLAPAYGNIEATTHELRLGALTRMSTAAEHGLVRKDYPVIAQSLALAASNQLRHMATLGGNVLQRTRCSYFRDPDSGPCNKRDPGSGCAALEGVNRRHAVLGVSQHCIATYPGDFAQALIALDASVEITGANGTRTIPVAQLHRLPGDTPHLETSLAPGELIVCFSVPAAPWTRRSLFLKVRDRQSYDFALASAAVALDMEGDRIRQARIALGGVATVPWRAREAEDALAGRPLTEATAGEAAEVAFSKAQTRSGNAFKAELGRRLVARALLQTAAIDL